MSAVQNFYELIGSRYPFAKQYEIWIPNQSEPRDLIGFKLLGPFKMYQTLHQKIDFFSRTQFTKIWMYDQEPVFANTFDTYNMRLRDWTEPVYHQVIDQYSPAQISACVQRTSTFPIWCTSELPCTEIDDLRRSWYLICYYWYHAFIAREWYNKYQYAPDFALSDRSVAPFRFLLYARDFTGTRTYRHEILERLQDLQATIHTNWHKKTDISPDLSAYIDANDANLAGIHLVAETLFDQNKMYLTEKVFKPMVMNQPFIVWGPPGSLEYLRRYGFETFGNIWSEAYDQETNHERRMHMLVELVKEIARMDQSQYHELYQKCLPVIAHNRKRFFSSDFLDHCWQELNDSFDRALEEKKHLDQAHPGGQFCRVVGENPELGQLPSVQATLKQMLIKMPDHQVRSLIKRHPHFNAQ